MNFSPCKPLWKYIIRISAAWGWAERQDQFQASRCQWVVRHFKFPDSSCPKLKGLWNILYLRWAFTCKCSALSRMPREFNIVQSPKCRCRRILTLPCLTTILLSSVLNLQYIEYSETWTSRSGPSHITAPGTQSRWERSESSLWHAQAVNDSAKRTLLDNACRPFEIKEEITVCFAVSSGQN